MEVETDSRRPIIKDGLFEPWNAVEARRDPIAGLGHGAGNPDVTWFVGTDQAESAEMAEQTDTGDGERRKNRGELWFGRCCGSLLRCGQGALSLTFKTDPRMKWRWGSRLPNFKKKQIPRCARDDNALVGRWRRPHGRQKPFGFAA